MEKVEELRQLLASALLIVDELNDDARRRKNNHLKDGTKETRDEAIERVSLAQMFTELRSASRLSKEIWIGQNERSHGLDLQGPE